MAENIITGEMVEKAVEVFLKNWDDGPTSAMLDALLAVLPDIERAVIEELIENNAELVGRL